MQKARGQLARSKDQIRLPQLVGKRFQVLFHSPLGVLFTFPSRYWFTIGRRRVFSLAGWSPRFPTEFHVFRGTRESVGRSAHFVYGAITRCGRPFQARSTISGLVNSLARLQQNQTLPTTPTVQRLQARTHNRFRLFPVRSPLLRESRFLSLPGGT